MAVVLLHSTRSHTTNRLATQKNYGKKALFTAIFKASSIWKRRHCAFTPSVRQLGRTWAWAVDFDLGLGLDLDLGLAPEPGPGPGTGPGPGP